MKRFSQLLEEKKKTLAMMFGRMNPPTAGHELAVNQLRKVADEHKADHLVIASHSQDSKKNPLNASTKLKHLKRAFPDSNVITSSKEKPTILHHATDAHNKGYNHLIVTGGSDRANEMKKLLHRYNGVEGKHGYFKFDKIDVHSAGNRDPNAKDVTGVSGTQMRKHVTDGNYKEFKKNLPSHVADNDNHSKELFHDVRAGMGLHENADHGQYKAIFVTGCPGSGKDIVIRNCIAEWSAIEVSVQTITQNLLEYAKAHGTLIITSSATELDAVLHIKNVLEEFDYETMIVFANTTNEDSKNRNSYLKRPLDEGVRYVKWKKSQINLKEFDNMFEDVVVFDNTGDVEEQVTYIYEQIDLFLSTKKYIPNLKDRLLENNSPIMIFKDKLGKQDDVRDGDPKSNKSYIFKTYSEEDDAKLKVNPEPKISNFSKDKEYKKKKDGIQDVPGKRIGTAGVGRELSTRGGGTVYPMSGLGNPTYSEAIDSPGFDMAFTGGYGASNKEPMDTQNDKLAANRPPSEGSKITLRDLRKKKK